MQTNNLSTIKHLQTAGICYLIVGAGFLYFGFPFWFLHAADENVEGHLVAPSIFLVDVGFTLILKSLNILITSIALFVGAYSLYKAGEPTGTGTKRNFIFVSFAGAVCYFLSNWLILPFAPLGALLNALGMLLISFAGFKTKVWSGWKRYTPLITGIFPFVFMFPLVIITKNRPAFMIGFWGIPWILLGIAAWQRSKEISTSIVNAITTSHSGATHF